MVVFACRYRITEGVNLPFRVLPTIKELGRTRMEVNVKVCDLKCWMFPYLKLPLFCTNLDVLIFRLRVSSVQKCLLLGLSSKSLYQNKQQKQVFK